MKNYWAAFKYGFFGALKDAKWVIITAFYICFGILSVIALFIIAVLMVIASRFKYEWR